MKHNPGMLERILERPSVEISSASSCSRKASLASDLPVADEPKPQVNGSSQTRYLRSAFLDVRVQDSPSGSEVQLSSYRNFRQHNFPHCRWVITIPGNCGISAYTMFHKQTCMELSVRVSRPICAATGTRKYLLLHSHPHEIHSIATFLSTPRSRRRSAERLAGLARRRCLLVILYWLLLAGHKQWQGEPCPSHTCGQRSHTGNQDVHGGRSCGSARPQSAPRMSQRCRHHCASILWGDTAAQPYTPLPWQQNACTRCMERSRDMCISYLLMKLCLAVSATKGAQNMTEMKFRRHLAMGCCMD